MTIKEWLALGDELGVELGRVLTPGPWEHSWVSNPNQSQCSRCNGECDLIATPQFCPVPDPIDVNDWNTAIEWFRKTDGAIDCLFAIWQHIDNNTEHLEMWGDWLCLNAQPKHLLISAARKMKNNAQNNKKTNCRTT